MAKARAPTIFTSPQDAALAFYQAFEAKDVDAMMATWAEDEDIVCIHPGGPRLVGYEAVRIGWEQLFAGETKLSFRLDEIVVIETVGLAMQSAVEHVTVGNDPKPRRRDRNQRLPAHAVGLAHRRAPRVARSGDCGRGAGGTAALVVGAPM